MSSIKHNLQKKISILQNPENISYNIHINQEEYNILLNYIKNNQSSNIITLPILSNNIVSFSESQDYTDNDLTTLNSTKVSKLLDELNDKINNMN